MSLKTIIIENFAESAALNSSGSGKVRYSEIIKISKLMDDQKNPIPKKFSGQDFYNTYFLIIGKIILEGYFEL